MIDDSLLPFSLPSVDRKKITPPSMADASVRTAA
jgi:hypothetical protein